MPKKFQFFYFIWWDDVKVYLCQKNILIQCIKKWKYIEEKIEMTFSFYEICNIY
jgi:hypothetical protein